MNTGAKYSQSGFTIIEMAIVMVIIGVIVGFGASLIGPLSIRAKRIESTDIVEAGAAAIVGHAAANEGALPNAAQFPGIANKRNDAWTRPIQYIYDAALADGNPATGDLCTRKATQLTLRQCSDATCSAPVTVPDVAFIILSGGENFNNQTAGDLAVAVPTVIDVYATGLDNVDNYATDMNRAEPYDDIVRWATLNELRGKVGCRGPQLTVLNNELPSGHTTSPYPNATDPLKIYVDGGVPFSAGGDYLWCVETPTGVAPAGLNFRDHMGTNDIGFDSDGSILAENSTKWTGADYIRISGTPTNAGSYLLTVWVRDNSNPALDAACSAGTNLDNCASRSFVLTVSP